MTQYRPRSQDHFDLAAVRKVTDAGVLLNMDLSCSCGGGGTVY
jgi:hypothetical protein